MAEPDTPAPGGDAAAQPPETGGSLRDHEAAFGSPSRRDLLREDTPPAREDSEAPRETDDPPEAAATFNPPRQGKYRAKSQQAKPDDVKTIQELTKRLRDAEAQVGVVVERKDGESERVYNLRRRAELAEAIRDTKKAATPPPRPAAPIANPSDFQEPEPHIEQYASAADPYTAWVRAVNAWDRRKETHDATQAQLQTQRTDFQRQVEARRDAAYASFGQRRDAFKAQTRDFDQVLQASADVPVTPLLETALVNHADGPRYSYLLAKDRRFADELFLLTDNKPVTQLTVGQVQRLLEARLSTVVAGSVETSAYVPPPKPPNPARSGAMKTVETPPGDSGSLADHERYYAPRSVRRRA